MVQDSERVNGQDIRIISWWGSACSEARAPAERELEPASRPVWGDHHALLRNGFVGRQGAGPDPWNKGY